MHLHSRCGHHALHNALCAVEALDARCGARGAACVVPPVGRLIESSARAVTFVLCCAVLRFAAPEASAPRHRYGARSEQATAAAARMQSQPAFWSQCRWTRAALPLHPTPR